MHQRDKYSSSKTFVHSYPFLIGPRETKFLHNACLWMGSSDFFPLFCTFQKNIFKTKGKIYFSFKSNLLCSTQLLCMLKDLLVTLLIFVEDSVSSSTDDTATDIIAGKPWCRSHPEEELSLASL